MMTQVEYIRLLNKKIILLEEIVDNTERQIRFLQGEHQSLRGLKRLLQVRGKLLQDLKSIVQKEKSGQEWHGCTFGQEKAEEIQKLQNNIIELQARLVQTASQKKNEIAVRLGGNRVTRNIRNAYIGRWYQGLSRGFSRTV
jgi:hypothetical protein